MRVRVRVRVPVLGAPIDAIDWPAALACIAQWSRRRESRSVCLCNAHSVVTASRDAAFAQAISNADLALPDGASVAWAMRRMGQQHQSRISGPDLMWRCLGDAAAEGRPVYLLGSTVPTLQKLQQALLARWPGLRIAGSESPPFRELSDKDLAASAACINASGAGLVFVGLGCPKQEMWMAAQRGHVQAVMLGVGAAFDFHAGNLRRAPKWMQRSGLEWLHRLLSEPRRLAWRTIDSNSAFIFGVLRQLLQRQPR